ncbi:HD-GYP domain-containing protein [Tepidibacillus sp. LV47]|uniref:HD-GYP domain-containing protein n=1 Tax=Tepidibacillus sp. LV47 TaxID=3398228 RepID=UPI003AABC792
MIFRINELDLVMALSSVIDLIDENVTDHHKRVAYIAFQIAKEMGLSDREQRELILAGALHDIGALSLQERIDITRFEKSYDYIHAEISYMFLKKFQPFYKVADIVRYHHTYYFDLIKDSNLRQQVTILSQILHLADRIEILINRSEQNILNQVKAITKKIDENKGDMFHPEVVEVFQILAKKEYFWFDLISPFIERILSNHFRSTVVMLDLNGLLELAKLFSQIIDFRSRFTSTHSSGVAATAEMLACLAGCTEEKCKMMRIAGYLHDLGKLAVPIEVLEKPGKLTEDEYNLVKQHVYYTKRVLEHMKDLEEIVHWASSHHERLDGKGYPFHYVANELNIRL